MKKLAIVSALALSSLNVNAFDYREELSPAFKPNVEMAKEDAKLRAKNAGEYEGEYLELICEIDGVAGKEVSVPINEWHKVTEREDIKYESEIKYEVEDRFYKSSLTTTGMETMTSSYMYVRVDRYTGEYTRTHWRGSLANRINHLVYSKPLLPAETKERGTCVPGAHAKKQLF
jgi:hypothetical protein